MKILVVSSCAIPTPPSKDAYGGLELVVGNFVSQATEMGGHDITLISATGSPLAGRWEYKEKNSTLDVRESHDASWNAGEFEHYLTYKDILENEFSDGKSIVWDNTWHMWAYISQAGGWFDNAGKWHDEITLNNGKKVKLKPHPGIRLLHTHHGMPNATEKPPVRFPRFVGVSNAHSQLLGSIMKIPVRTVHNGIRLPEWKPDEFTDDGYLLSLNRITGEKGIHDSIDIAMQHDMPIKCLGDDTQVNSQQYVSQIIQRCRDSRGLAEYYGLVDNETKEDALKHCKAVIACPFNQGPLGWTEAFGLYAVEGLSYGKPFVGLANGGLMDIVEQGKHGFLGLTPTITSSYIPNLADIKAEDCRRRVEEKFSMEVMANNYLSLFDKVLDDNSEAGKW